MLTLSSITSGYGETQVLHSVSCHIKKGNIHALLGRNGVGKSTLLKTIAGHVACTAGSIDYDGQQIAGQPAHKIAHQGIAFVPETRDIFSTLTVRENLTIAARLAGNNAPWTPTSVLTAFPQLTHRLTHRGWQLSGGEQQLLAIARALVTQPRLLLLDEPTEGLAPMMVDNIQQHLSNLKQQGIAVLLVEQKVHFALQLADEASIMQRGTIVWQGNASALQRDTEMQTRYLGIGKLNRTRTDKAG